MAEEVTQDVFLQLARQPAIPRDPVALRTWLLRCVWFLSSNARRKQARWHSAVNRLAEESQRPAVAAPAADHHDLLELDRALEGLPDKERGLLLEHFFEGRDYGELAARHGLSPEAVRKRLARSLQRLKRHFTRRGLLFPGSVLAATFGAAPFSSHAELLTAGVSTPSFFAMNATTSAVLTAAACLTLASLPLFLQNREIQELKTSLANLSPVVGFAAPQTSGHPVPATSETPKKPRADATSPETSGLLGLVLRALPDITAAPAGQANRVLIDTMAHVLKDPVTARRESYFTMLCGLLRVEDFTAIQRLFDQEGERGVLRVPELVAFSHRKGQLQGQAALEEKVGSGPRATLDRISAALVEGWASQNPKAVYQWIQALPEGLDFRNQALQPLFHAAVSGNREFAMKMIEASPKANVAPMLRQLAQGELDRGGADGLEAWFRTLPDKEEWTAARRDLAFLTAERQSFAGAEAGLRWLQESFDQSWGGPELAQRIATRFGHVNHGKVIGMLELLPPEAPLAATLTDTLFATMAVHQRNLAADFLDRHPAFLHYDRAAEAFVRGIQNQDPIAARAWAATVKDPARRETLLQAITK